MNEYISREAVLQKFLERGSGYINELTMLYMINEIPAADVQPARFARWIDLDDRILCSGCGAGYDDYDEVKQNTYIFCPNCGARMDGDTNV